jgi:hypothetical protein
MATRSGLVKRGSFFPNVAFSHTRPSADIALATNGYLSSILPLADRTALREINVHLTQLAIDQCGAGVGAANQIQFGTLICLALAEFAAHVAADEVFPDYVLALSRERDVVFPWSLSYGSDRNPFNFRFVKLPLAIAFPRTVEDVVFWVDFARNHELGVSIRSGNNSYEGLSSSNEVIIDLTFLTLGPGSTDAQFEVDTEANLVHVAAGVRLGVLYTELDKLGLTLAGGGQCAPVCVGGLVGTGGVGFSTRRFGFACDQLVEVQYVLADGSVVVANATNEHADLYRASKGAGAAGLGVMTRLTLRVVEAVCTLFYNTVFALEDGAAVLAAWQNLAAAAPDALSSIAAANASSDGAAVLIINGEFRVEGVKDCHDPKVAEAKQTLTKTLQDHWLSLLPPPLDQTSIVIEEMSALEAANTVAFEVPMPVYNHWKLKSKFAFRSLTAAEFQPIIDFLLSQAPTNDPTRGAGFLNLLLMGGQSNQVDPNSAVVPAREGTVLWYHAGALWTEQALEPQSLAFVDALWDVMNPILQSSTAQYSVPDLQLGAQLKTSANPAYVHAYWSSPTHDFVPFLIGVKNKYDPCDLFKFAQSIPLSL